VRSLSGLLAALLLLLAFPLAVVCQIVLGAGAETVVHLVGGAGFVFLARSFFDFALPRWVSATGAAAAGGMGLIFILQALATVIPSEALNAVAFGLLGDLPEQVLIALLLVCLTATCLQISQGALRLLGLATLLVVVGTHLWRIYAQNLGIAQPAELRLIYLLPFVWLLLESRAQAPRSDATVRATAAVTASGRSIGM
jgi:hypothetical protein